MLIDTPMGVRGLLISKPVYRSTYVFVTRRSSPAITSLDDVCEPGDFLYRPIIGLMNLNHSSQSRL